jgi:polysaccharide deacetylase family protein (PEP-CTERM system associated)
VLDTGSAHTVVNAMTIDVEDYFHVSVFDGVLPRHRWDTMDSRVVRNTERLLAIFDDAGVKATFFVLGWVAERFPALVSTIGSLGHEVASHGYGHRLIYDQTQSAFREDVRRSKGLIEAAAGRAVLGYRAPSYSITPRTLWALDILIEQGYAYDSSIFPIHHDRYGIPVSPRHLYLVRRPRGTIIEAPGSTAKVGPLNLPVGGGGYFRILPYAWTRWGISRVNRRECCGAIFYLHPWEIDPDQPRLDAPFVSRFRHYRNLHKTETRLRALLGDFAFAPMQAVFTAPAEDWAPAVQPLPYCW